MAQSQRIATDDDESIFISSVPSDIAEGDRRIYALLDSGVPPSVVDIRLNCSKRRVEQALARRPRSGEAADPSATEPWQFPCMEPPKKKALPLLPLNGGAKPLGSSPKPAPAPAPDPRGGREDVTLPPMRRKESRKQLIRNLSGRAAPRSRKPPVAEKPVEPPPIFSEQNPTQSRIELVMYHARIEFGMTEDNILATDPRDIRARHARFAILLVLKGYGIDSQDVAPMFKVTPGMAHYMYVSARMSIKLTRGPTCRTKAEALAQRVCIPPRKLYE